MVETAMPLAQNKPQRFTYSDYLTWPHDERWELLGGIPFNMSPGPSRRHQEVTGELFRQISNFLLDHDCKVYMAPFDVRLPEEDEADEKVHTVVQPDILVVCDHDKLDEQGCRGAPDFVIEVLSPATASRDQIEKANLYEKHGVREYWTVHPVDRMVYVQRQNEEGEFDGWSIHNENDALPVEVLPGLVIELQRVFAT